MWKQRALTSSQKVKIAPVMTTLVTKFKNMSIRGFGNQKQWLMETENEVLPP